MNIELILTSLLQGLTLAFVALGIMIPFRLLDFPDLTAERIYPFSGAVCTSIILDGVHPCFAVIVATIISGLVGMITAIIHLRLRINTLLKSFLLFYLLYSNLVFANTYSEINYKITSYLTQNIPFIKVETEIKGELSGQIIIDLPSHWANANYTKQIRNIKLQCPKEEIKLEHNNDNQVVINMLTSSHLILSYEIQQVPGDPSCVHETIIRKNLLHSIGYGLFAVPHELKESDHKINFQITCKKFPLLWKTLSSNGTGRTLQFTDSTRELLHAVYVVGKVRIYKFFVHENPVYLSLYGKFDLKDNAIITDLKEIITTQRTFFKDYDFPYYAISLIEGDDPGWMGGTGLHNSFTAYMSRGCNKNRLIYYILLAHELVHTWIGTKIRNDEPGEELNYWWTEGFTDYYTRVLALRSGGISFAEFMNECNILLREYYLSPVINESNSRIKIDFWKNPDVQALPYRRGFVFAMYLNHLIKQNNPKASLDNVMHDLFKEAKQNNTPFSTENFKKIVKSYISQGIEQEITKFIDQGEIIKLDTLVKIFPIEKVKMGTYYLGFNEDKLMGKKVIEEIDESSNAYKAGLRNGDQIIEYSFPRGFGNPERIAIIKINIKEIKFKPESANKKDVYQFKSDLSEEYEHKIKAFFGAS